MKKLIIIAIFTFSANVIFAQNQNNAGPDSKVRQERQQFIDAELAKIASQQASQAPAVKQENVPAKQQVAPSTGSGASKENHQTTIPNKEADEAIKNATTSGSHRK